METKTMITAVAAVAGALCLYKATKAKSKAKQMWVIAAILLLGGAATGALLMGGNGALDDDGTDKSLALGDEAPSPPLTPEKEAQVETKVQNTLASIPIPPETQTALLNVVMEAATTGSTQSVKEEAIRQAASSYGVSPGDADALISTLRASTGESGTTYIPPKASGGGKGKDQSKEWAMFMVQEDPGAYAVVGLDGKIAGKVQGRIYKDDLGYTVNWVGDKPPAGVSLWPDTSKPVSDRVPEATRWAAWEALMTELKKQGVKDKTPA